MTLAYRAPLLLALVIPACSGEPSREEQAAKAREDAAAVASVEAAQTLPLVPIAPAAITFSDIERNDLFGAGCAFAPEGAPSDILALAQGGAGYLKIDGRIERFAPDAGSKELPYLARARYTSTQRTFELTYNGSEGRQTGPETIDYPGSLVVRDESDRVAYQQRGTVQCGA